LLFVVVVVSFPPLQSFVTVSLWFGRVKSWGFPVYLVLFPMQSRLPVQPRPPPPPPPPFDHSGVCNILDCRTQVDPDISVLSALRCLRIFRGSVLTHPLQETTGQFGVSLSIGMDLRYGKHSFLPSWVSTGSSMPSLLAWQFI